MPTLSELLAEPSVENWKAIIEIGKRNKKIGGLAWTEYTDIVQREAPAWPPEIERVCPESWPREFKDLVEHRVRETDTYGHYLAKICGHPDLRLADGSQAVWLERRFTGGVVPVSTAQSALRLLSAALAASSTTGMTSRVKQAINILSSGVRNVGKVGCADLTGGVRMDFDKMQYYGDGNQQWAEVRLEVEIKVGDEDQRPEQVARMHSVRARGGCYVLARSVEDAVSQIKAFIEGVRP